MTPSASCTKCHTTNSGAAFRSGPFCYAKSIVTADDRAAPFCYAYEWEEERFSSGAPGELHAAWRGDGQDASLMSAG